MNNRLTELQATYPIFKYTSATVERVGDTVVLSYTYEIGVYHFTHKLILHGPVVHTWEAQATQDIQRLVFELGLVEMLSYWKLTCSPTIEITAGNIVEGSQEFWKKLIKNGMGEFFYVNDITPFSPILSATSQQPAPKAAITSDVSSLLIPVGGGKDSAVTLELLQGTNGKRVLFTVGEDQATEEEIDVYTKTHGQSERVHIERLLDPQIVELNKEGFLNGHIPFSSVLAMSAVLVAKVLNIPSVVLSNERGANEATLELNGVHINHQYSKTLEFEQDFRRYTCEILGISTNYFSLLRPLYELQIAQIFSRYPQYHGVFRSCNVGKKENVWCGTCAKCLFVFIMLAAVMDIETVINIFGSNILENKELESLLDQLSGKVPAKAFECIGTRDETRLGLFAIVKRYGAHELPVLLKPYKEEFAKDHDALTKNLDATMHAWTDDHCIPASLVEVVQHAAGI